MKKIQASVVALTALIAVPAGAQTSVFPPGFFVESSGDFSFVFGDGYNDRYFQSYSHLGIMPDGQALGFALGIDLRRVPNDFDYGFYPTIEIDTQIGRISVGNPQSVIDRGYGPQTMFAGSGSLDTINQFVGHSVLRKQILIDDARAFGLRFDAQVGTTKVGFSTHRLDDPSDDYNIWAAAFYHEMPATDSLDQLAIFGEIENADGGPDEGTNIRLGATAKAAKFSYGATLYSFPWDERAFQVDVGYAVSDQLMISGTGYVSSQNENAYGATAKYTLSTGHYVDIGIYDGSFTDAFGEISAGWHF